VDRPSSILRIWKVRFLRTHQHLYLIEDTFAFRGNQAADDLLGNILRAVAQQMLQFLGVKLLNNFLLPLDNIRILLVERLQTPFILEEHLQQSSSPFEHFIEAILKAGLQAALSLWLLCCGWCAWLGVASILVLGIPDVVGDELLYFLLLFVGEVLLSDFVRAEHFHEASNVLDQDVVACDHYLLL
jgi:hypothetical protein